MSSQRPIKKDKYYPKVTDAVRKLLKRESFVSAVDVLIEMGYLTRADLEDWRFGRVPYLERVIKLGLGKIQRILHILRIHAKDRGLRPSETAYKKWGKGPKHVLRF